MVVVAGTEIAVIRPWAFVSPLGTTWPARSLAVGAPWPTGWLPVGVTQNGWQVTTVNPKVDIPSDELGPIDVLPSGADTVNITGQPKRPRAEIVKWINAFSASVAAAVTGTAEVRNLALSGTASASGASTVVLGGTSYTVTGIVSTDTASGAATKLAISGNYTPALAGWTVTSSGANVIYTSTGTGPQTGAFSATLPTGLTPAFTTTTPGVAAVPEAEVMVPNPDEPTQYFQFGFEGKIQAGSLYPEDRYIRFLTAKVNQTDNPQNHARTHGADSLWQPVMTVRCLPVDPASLTLPSDVSVALIDPANKKAFKCAWMAIKAA